jgi:hypothetical protein
MSVIDFLSVRKTAGDGRAAQGGAQAARAPLHAPQLSASQFTRHIAQIAEDETRRALKRQVDTVDPRDMIDLAKMIAELKAKYVATTLAFAGNRTPVTESEIDQLRGLRLRLQEVEAAYAEVNNVIGAQLVEVRGVSAEK